MAVAEHVVPIMPQAVIAPYPISRTYYTITISRIAIGEQDDYLVNRGRILKNSSCAIDSSLYIGTAVCVYAINSVFNFLAVIR